MRINQLLAHAELGIDARNKLKRIWTCALWPWAAKVWTDDAWEAAYTQSEAGEPQHAARDRRATAPSEGATAGTTPDQQDTPALGAVDTPTSRGTGAGVTPPLHSPPTAPGYIQP